MARKYKRSSFINPVRNIIHYIYRHPQTGRIVVTPDRLNTEAIHRMGVSLIACQCFGE